MDRTKAAGEAVLDGIGQHEGSFAPRGQMAAHDTFATSGPICGDESISAPEAKRRTRSHPEATARQVICDSCWKTGMKAGFFGVGGTKTSCGGCAGVIAVVIVAVSSLVYVLS